MCGVSRRATYDLVRPASSRLSHDDVTKISLRPVSFSSAGCDSPRPHDPGCAVAGRASVARFGERAAGEVGTVSEISVDAGKSSLRTAARSRCRSGPGPQRSAPAREAHRRRTVARPPRRSSRCIRRSCSGIPRRRSSPAVHPAWHDLIPASRGVADHRVLVRRTRGARQSVDQPLGLAPSWRPISRISSRWLRWSYICIGAADMQPSPSRSTGSPAFSASSMAARSAGLWSDPVWVVVIRRVLSSVVAVVMARCPPAASSRPRRPRRRPAVPNLAGAGDGPVTPP